MRSVFNLIKRGAKWYFNKSSEIYTWLPTGTLPYKG